MDQFGVMLGQCSVHLCYNFALRFLKWVKFSLNSGARTTEENVIYHDYDHIRAMSGPFLGRFRIYFIDSTKVISSKVAKFGSMDVVELHGDILQPWGAT